MKFHKKLFFKKLVIELKKNHPLKIPVNIFLALWLPEEVSFMDVLSAKPHTQSPRETERLWF